MAVIEPQTPQISREPLEALGPFTETELCKPVALKLILKDLAASKDTNSTLRTDLQNERTKNDSLIARAIHGETELRVLNGTLYLRDRRDLIIRLVELIIIGLIEFAIEAAKSAAWGRFGALCLFSLVSIVVIALIQWQPRPPQKTQTQDQA